MDPHLFAILLPPAALALDLLLGDPPGLPHPVRYVGRWLNRAENVLRRAGLDTRPGGALAVVAFCAAAGLLVKILTAIPWLGVLAAVYFAWAGLALGQLLREGRRAARLLAAGDLEGGRTAVAGLVSRDVSDMDEAGLRRSLAESLSENLSDAFVAPFFFLCVFGPAGLWVQRVVSTMDSMWGYRTEAYSRLGWAAAKCDDVLCWLPARLTGFALLGAGWLLKLDWQSGYDNILDDAGKMESPNAGWPMAATAWLVGASMGGPTVYFGEVKDKPLLGPDGEWTDEKLHVLMRLLLGGGLVAAGVLYLYVWALA